MPTDHVFVYGTLRRSASHPMHGLLQPATFVGMGTFQGKLYDLGNYPGVVASGDVADVVYGEVYRLLDPVGTLARLDDYEGCAGAASPSTEYIRAEAEVGLSAGGSVPVYLYLYRRPLEGVRWIESGDYLAEGGTASDSLCQRKKSGHYI